MIRIVMKVGVRREADGLTVFTVTPEASPEDLIQALTVFMRDAPTPLVLWDLRQGNFGRFTGDELRWMVSRLPVSSTKRAAGRSALLAHDVDHGVMRTFITYAELSGYGVSFRVFSDVDDARAWLLDQGPAT